MSRILRCPLCGHAYDPETASSLCARCPLNTGCELTCCPACGHGTVDVETSRAATWLAGRLRLRDQAPGDPAAAVPLTTLAAGSTAAIHDFDPAMYPGHRQRLQGFGVGPGCTVEVVRQAAVTVFRVDHTELAVDRDVSSLILVEPHGPAPMPEGPGLR